MLGSSQRARNSRSDLYKQKQQQQQQVFEKVYFKNKDFVFKYNISWRSLHKYGIYLHNLYGNYKIHKIKTSFELSSV